MGTSCTIALLQVDGTFKSIYCHYDGYPAHMMPILMQRYLDENRVKELLELGNISVLDNFTDCPEGHSGKVPAPNRTVAYIRDCGEDEKRNQAKTYSDAALLEIDSPTDYIYIYDVLNPRAWTCKRRY